MLAPVFRFLRLFALIASLCFLYAGTGTPRSPKSELSANDLLFSSVSAGQQLAGAALPFGEETIKITDSSATAHETAVNKRIRKPRRDHPDGRPSDPEPRSRQSPTPERTISGHNRDSLQLAEDVAGIARSAGYDTVAERPAERKTLWDTFKWLTWLARGLGLGNRSEILREEVISGMEFEC